jgi:hypothetical protein
MGYLKEVNHMREMIFRKENNEGKRELIHFIEEELYDVQYFDLNNIVDELTRDMLNSKIKELKGRFEEKTKDLINKLYFFGLEIERLKQMSQ